MAFAIDDILEIFVAKVGESLGKQLADDIFNAIFGDLVTKAELQQAVTDIENYVHQEFEDLAVENVQTNVNNALSELSLWSTSGHTDQHRLDAAKDALVSTQSSLTTYTTRYGIDFLRLTFGYIVPFLACDLSCWISNFFYIANSGHSSKQEVLGAYNELTTRIDADLVTLNNAIAQIQDMETESISALQSESTSFYEPAPPPEKGENRVTRAHAWFVVSQKASGDQRTDNGSNVWPFSNEVAARAQLQPQYVQATADVNARNATRVQQIYTPSQQFITAISGFKTRLATYESDRISIRVHTHTEREIILK
jgi:hypothetical protein